MPDLALERAALADGLAPVAGVDEAGRGPWAGPVVAAAVVLDGDRLGDELVRGLDDSKKLKPAVRETLFAALAAGPARIGIGIAEVDEIDGLNILRATMLAMTRAVADLGALPALALVDGNRAPELPCPARAVVGGDGRSLSVAAASVIAKVTRDRLMADLARAFPGYGWERNMGYGTAEHRAALEALGATPHHRRSFRPVLNILSRSPAADATSGPRESG